MITSEINGTVAELDTFLAVEVDSQEAAKQGSLEVAASLGSIVVVKGSLVEQRLTAVP